MSEGFGVRVGEALVRGTTKPTAAEPEIIIGELNGPVGQSFANLMGDQVKGHTRVLALLNGDVAVKPATLMVSKVTVESTKYTNILMGTVQAAVANGVLDAVREGILPKEKANDLCIIAAIWVTPAAATDPNLDHQDLFDTHRKAMVQAIRKRWPTNRRSIGCLRTKIRSSTATSNAARLANCKSPSLIAFVLNRSAARSLVPRAAVFMVDD